MFQSRGHRKVEKSTAKKKVPYHSFIIIMAIGCWNHRKCTEAHRKGTEAHRKGKEAHRKCMEADRKVCHKNSVNFYWLLTGGFTCLSIRPL